MRMSSHSKFLVILISILLRISNGLEYGPSISSLTGVYVNWKGPDLLSLESGKKVVLEKFPGYAATLPLITGKTSATSEQIFKERGISTVGEFIVEAPLSFGIIVVIQELKLRQTTKDRGTPNATLVCSDYIQIAETNSGAEISEKICGTVLKNDLLVSPPGISGPRTFRTSQSRLRIIFSHAYVNELVESLLGSKQRHILKAEIAFTAYKTNCTFLNATSAMSTNEDNKKEEDEELEICNDYQQDKNTVCVSSKLLCDEVYNCGGDFEKLGSDDNGITCPDKPAKTTENTPTEEDSKVEDKLDLSNLSKFLGIPSLASYTTKRYERKLLRPSYITVGSNTGKSDFPFDYSSATTRQPLRFKLPSTITKPPSTSVTTPGESKEIESSSSTEESRGADRNQVLNDVVDSEIYSKRELEKAINSVIYGVAVFIIFTIFITVAVVCVTKRVQTAWCGRHRRQDHSCEPPTSVETRRSSIAASESSRRVSTLAIPTSTSTSIVVPSRRESECSRINYQNVILVDGDEEAEESELPPSYSNLFPEI